MTVPHPPTHSLTLPSGFTGGDDEAITMGNFFKFYNPSLFGLSLGSHIVQLPGEASGDEHDSLEHSDLIQTNSSHYCILVDSHIFGRMTMGMSLSLVQERTI